MATKSSRRGRGRGRGSTSRRPAKTVAGGDTGPAHRRKALLAHQTFTIDYMLKHPRQHGLLVAHQMGTGKTLLGIGMADALQGHAVVVIAPGQLEGVWRHEFGKYQLANSNVARFSFATYSASALAALGDLTDTFVIMDEAHRIVRAMQDAGNAGAAVLAKLQACWKVLLLTGTPIYNSETDFIYLANIAAGGDVLPTDPSTFLRRYTKIHLGRAAFTGYYAPIVKLTAGVVPLLSYAMLPVVLYTKAFGDKTSPLVAGPLRALAGGPKALLRLVVTRAVADTGNRRKSLAEINAPDAYRDATLIVASLTVASLMLLLLNALNFVLAKAFKTEQLQLRYLDTAALRPVIHQYVSFYQIDTADFATKTFYRRNVDYTSEQFGFFLRFCDGMLSASELQKIALGIDAPTAAAFGGRAQEALHGNIENGLKIGNLHVGEAWPRKFDGILSLTQGGTVPALVYSNFYEHGISLLAGFLTAKGVRFVVLAPADGQSAQEAKLRAFNEGEVAVALLHPDMTEGLSFVGVRQVHFLEPVMQQAVRDQVVARAVRFKSHAHLPAAQRRVDIHTWVTTFSLASFGAITEKLQRWKDFKREVLPGTEHVKFNYEALKPDLQKMTLLSPDSIQMTRITGFGENVKLLLEAMAQHSIERRS